MSRLAGKVALVTGASRGIGRAIACRLAADGAFVVIHYGKSEEGARETLAMIEVEGGSGCIVQADLGKPAQSVIPMFEAIDGELMGRQSGKDLDILVNNAGQMVIGTIETITEAQFDDAFTVDVKAPFFITQAALARLRDGGRIINISSGTARVVNPGVIAYAMAKGVLEVFSKTLALHLGQRQITVNTVAPGPTGTEEFLRMSAADPGFVKQAAAQSALGRIGTPEEIADIVAFVASGESNWITGQVIDATGGTFLG